MEGANRKEQDKHNLGTLARSISTLKVSLAAALTGGRRACWELPSQAEAEACLAGPTSRQTLCDVLNPTPPTGHRCVDGAVFCTGQCDAKKLFSSLEVLVFFCIRLGWCFPRSASVAAPPHPSTHKRACISKEKSLQLLRDIQPSLPHWSVYMAAHVLSAEHSHRIMFNQHVVGATLVLGGSLRTR